MRRIKALFLAVVLIFVAGYGYQFYDRQFRPANIKFEVLAELSSRPAPEEEALLAEVFSQEFSYLDRGKQSFVFLSKDGNTILKFFDAHVLKVHPFFSDTSEVESMHRKVEGLFEGYRIAYTEDRENSGLLYVSLGTNSQLPYIVTVRDRFGVAYQIALNSVPFILQAKAVPTRRVISDLLFKRDIVGAKQRLEQILKMYLEGYQKGLYDDDHNFMYNTGFIGERPIRIDSGRLQAGEAFKEKSFYEKDLEKIVFVRLSGWLQRHFPSCRDEIMKDIEIKIRTSL